MEKVIRKYLIAMLLLIVGAVFSVVLYSEVYPTSIQRYNGYLYNPGPLIKGRIIRGSLSALYNNLGTVKLKVTMYNRINYDTIHFRLREKGTNQWRVDNRYAVDRFPDGDYYSFGFPVYPDSVGKEYEFELSSDTGTSDNSIGALGGYHAVGEQYAFQKSAILSNTSSLVGFTKEKLLSLFVDPFFYPYFLLFIIPAFCYMFRRFQMVGLLYTTSSFLFVPFVLAGWGALYVAAVIGILTISIKRSSLPFHLALITLVAMLVLMALGMYPQAVGAARMTFLLLALGVSYSLIYGT